MKSLKAAAVVAGSLALTGVAAPAFADDLTPSSLNGAVENLDTSTLLETPPVHTTLLEADRSGSLPNAVQGAVDDLGSAGGQNQGLLGGLPVGG
ncbi:hypothetical protein DSC45_29030 [Streptomyces sp. YIM 130001]|uniref:hypothetical protein n=1 Tax=Streptomyces sp. YIM 130001 TaxID=2259644 RepID=UPI000E65A30B|nr:hypothetical protein [Streptomyces sp. YIM 130001]RII11198.1 hypothetical protein DSC45_29030 [Streptomyces sp. YIM 130001]